jgi:hypothetical protein
MNNEPITDEELTRILNCLDTRLKHQNINPNSKRGKEAIADYMAGALIALNKTNTGIVMCIMSGRNVLKEYERYLITEKSSTIAENS